MCRATICCNIGKKRRAPKSFFFIWNHSAIRAVLRASPSESAGNKPIICRKGRKNRGRATRGRFAHGSIAADDVASKRYFIKRASFAPKRWVKCSILRSTLSTQPLPKGRRVAILTNAGGLGILCADACEANGLVVAAAKRSNEAPIERILVTDGER